MMSDWLDTILNDTANQTNQVKIIYNELVSDIAENFGQRMAEQMYLSEEEEYRGSEDVTTPQLMETDCHQKNSEPKNSEPQNSEPKNSEPKKSEPKNSEPRNSEEKVAWKPKDLKGKRGKGHSPKTTKPTKEKATNGNKKDLATILKYQLMILRKIKYLTDKQEEEEKRRKEGFVSDIVKAGFVSDIVKTGLVNDIVNDVKAVKEKLEESKEEVQSDKNKGSKYKPPTQEEQKPTIEQENITVKASETEPIIEQEQAGIEDWSLEISVSDSLREELDQREVDEHYSAVQAVSDAVLELSDISDEEPEELQANSENKNEDESEGVMGGFNQEEATNDLRNLLGMKRNPSRCRVCENKRPHQWCQECRMKVPGIMIRTYSQVRDFGTNVPQEQEVQSEALEWACKQGKEKEKMPTPELESEKESYHRKLDRLLPVNSSLTNEGKEVQELYSSYMNSSDPVGRSFMKRYYPTCEPLFSKDTNNKVKCCDDKPTGTIRQNLNHTLEEHSHVTLKKVQCLPCLATGQGREAFFSSPGRLAKHISNSHEKLLMTAHMRAKTSKKSDIWLQAYSQCLIGATIDKLHQNGYLSDNFYLGKPRKARTK